MKFYGNQPYPHQMESFKLALNLKAMALLWEMGVGKTYAIVNILRILFGKEKRIKRTLILTPLVTIYNWKDEFLKFSKIPKNDIVVIDCNGPKRNKLLLSHIENFVTKKLDQNKIIIVNWEALNTASFYSYIEEWAPEIIVGDELHYIKNYKSKRGKKAVELADQCRKINGNIYGLTGTLSLNGIQDIFMQFRFLDGGQLFGKSAFNFQHIYMADENAGWKGKANYFPKMTARPEKFDEIHEKIKTIATIVKKEECLKDLPPKITINRDIPMGKDQAKHYRQMEKEFITFVQNEKNKGQSEAVVAKLAVTKALRLMQILSGFVMTEEGNEIEFADNPRLKDVEETLIEVTPNHKIILWCCFKNNYKQLGKLCEKLKIKHVFIVGGMDIRAKGEAMDEFRNKSDCRVVIANRRAGGIGINLVEASYSYVYSRNFSLGEELQSDARNYRGGSQIHDKIFRVVPKCRNTIEEVLSEALIKKENIGNKILAWAENAC